MITRVFVLVVGGLVLTGCAGEAIAPVNAGFAGPSGMASTGSGAGYASTAQERDGVPRKTLASKMLAAIALERVTGRKPDPSRLTE